MMRRVVLTTAVIALLSAWQIPKAPAPTYTGPGDIVTLDHFWGLRAASAAAAAAHVNAVRLRRTSDNAETDITVLSNGTIDAATIASHCAATTCFVAKWYDQIGSVICNGGVSTCEMVQATAGNQPELITSCDGLAYCIRFTAATAHCLRATKNDNADAQPYSMTAVTYRNGNQSASYGSIYTIGVLAASGSVYHFFSGGATLTAGERQGATAGVTTAIANATWYSTQIRFNGASSVHRYNGTEATVTLGATTLGNGGNDTWSSGGNNACGAGSYLNGNMVEVAYSPTGWDATARAAVENNQRTYWGF